MPAAIGLLIAPVSKLYLQASIHNLILIHRLGLTSRPLRYLLKPPYNTFFSPSSTSIPPYNPFRRHCAIAQSGSLRPKYNSTRCCNFKPLDLRLNIPSGSRRRTLKLELGSSPRLNPYRRPQKSRFQSWTVVIVISIITGAFLLHPYNPSATRDLDKSVLNLPKISNLGRGIEFAVRDDWSKMTGEELPGRPGNLTPEQEEKLREIWIATLQVFGVLDSHRAKQANDSGQITVMTGAHPTSDPTTSEKPKKRRLAIFGRKHKDSDTDSMTSTDSTSPGLSPGLVADSDDKYGQTKQFHDTLSQQSPESLRAAFWSMVKHDHPDALLLRFLRARKWDVEKALVMMVSTMHWRAKEMHVDDDIMKSGEEGSLVASQSSNPTVKKSGEDFLAQMRMGKSFLHGVDKSGRPMCFVRVRLHKQGEQTEESLERYTVFVIESARMILAPPVDTACIVFDMTGFSLANMDYSPVKFMIKCFEANYPESLGVVLVHKAPWVFQGIWKIIKGWLDPVVASKVHFTNNVEEMEEFVPRCQIPKDLGGDENWSYHYVEPAANENETMKDSETTDKLMAERRDIVKEYEKATLEWIDHSSPSEALEIKATRHKLAAALKEDYWKLDPYIRARSLYDRIGMIQPGGKICFYPTTTQAATAVPNTNGVQRVETSVDDID